MQNVVVGFLRRWAVELGGLLTIAIGLYTMASPSDQVAIQSILTGQGGGLSLNTYIGLAIYLFNRWRMYVNTIEPQVVTTDGKKVVPKPGSAVEGQIDAVVVGVQPKSLKPTLWEQITSGFRR